jgi:hypothetical protein
MIKKRGHGTREVIACLDEIQDMLNKGYTISAIYRKLHHDEKKITIGIKRFYAILSKKGLKKVSMKQLKIQKDILNQPVKNNIYQDISKIPAAQENKNDGFTIIKKPEDEVF